MCFLGSGAVYFFQCAVKSATSGQIPCPYVQIAYDGPCPYAWRNLVAQVGVEFGVHFIVVPLHGEQHGQVVRFVGAVIVNVEYVTVVIQSP